MLRNWRFHWRFDLFGGISYRNILFTFYVVVKKKDSFVVRIRIQMSLWLMKTWYYVYWRGINIAYQDSFLFIILVFVNRNHFFLSLLMDSTTLIVDTKDRAEGECPPAVIQLFKMMNKLQYYCTICAVYWCDLFLVDHLYLPSGYYPLQFDTYFWCLFYSQFEFMHIPDCMDCYLWLKS